MAIEAGRNDPCPCGSGKKYKKCCLLQDEGHAAEPSKRWHDLDGRLAVDMGRYAGRRFGAAWAGVADDYPIDLDVDADASLHGPLFMTWALYEHKFEGRPIVDWFLEDRGRNLPGDERAWLEAQRRAGMSVLEVTDVAPGSRVEVLDLLTGRRHSVTEIVGSETLSKSLLLLGRVVEHDNLSLFCGLHPNPLTALEGPVLVDQVRALLGLPKNVEASRLRHADSAAVMIEQWQNAVHGLHNRPLPRLTNTDGDELVLTTDAFTYASPQAKAKAEIATRLASQPDVVPPDPGDRKPTYTILDGRPGEAKTPASMVGTVRLLAKELRLETNSLKRGDALRTRLESLCAGLIRHQRRSTEDQEALLAAMDPGGRSSEAITGPDAEGLILELKRAHYATWTTEPLPALDGLSPRDAAQDPTYRRRLVALLKDMERLERDDPPGQRYDFDALWTELGISR